MMHSTTRIVLSLLVIFGFPIYNPFAQISPGDLAKPHAHLEGLSNCTKCHTLGKKVVNEKCLDCHKEIKERIDQRKGYHSSAEIRGKNCFECHSDHHGVKFEMIRFDLEKFNHSLTGYKLLGAHARKKCKDCHKSKYISDQEIKKKTYTYLGLNTTCLTCHTDYHQKTLSPDCASCHDFDAFKPAPLFDHSKSKFKLIGIFLPLLFCNSFNVVTSSWVNSSPLSVPITEPVNGNPPLSFINIRISIAPTTTVAVTKYNLLWWRFGCEL